MLNKILTKLTYNDTEVTIIGLQLEKSFSNTGLIANIAFQTSENTWCAKTAGISESDIYLDDIIEQIFEHGCNLDKELAEGMFPFILFEYTYY